MSREIPGFVAKLGPWTIRARDGVDGLLILEPYARGGHLVTLTMRTWRELPDHPAANERFEQAFRDHIGLTQRIEVVLDEAQVQGGRQLQGHRDQFAVRRRRRPRSGPGDGDADVVGLWVARQGQRP
jgi:hypothetical protein